MSLTHWLHRPYPLLTQRRYKFALVFGFSLFTYFFLLLYQPYGAEKLGDQGPVFLLGFGGMVGLGLSINYFLLPSLCKTWFDADEWQVRKELAYLSFSFLLIGTLNYWYNTQIGKDFAPQHSLLAFWGITLSIGIFPTIISVFLVELYLNRSNAQKAQDLNAVRTPAIASQSTPTLRIVSENQQVEELRLALVDFIYATSDANYCSIFYWKEGEVQRQLFRLSLKGLNDQLADQPSLVRCHRSYLINKTHIVRIDGNARSLFVQLKGVDAPIPVSRTFPREDLL